jgi:hypothetical protein
VPALPAFAGPQIPSAADPRAAVHTSHAALHAVAQHTPSAAIPVAHVPAVVAGWPFLRPHAPAPLHVDVLAQLLCGSAPSDTALHVPFDPPGACKAVEHAWQVGHDALPQQTPSTHEVPPPHSRQPWPRQSLPAATLHDAPCALWGWQVPPLPQ